MMPVEQMLFEDNLLEHNRATCQVVFAVVDRGAWHDPMP